jgi:superoxide dismutase, Fe-Mn family
VVAGVKAGVAKLKPNPNPIMMTRRQAIKATALASAALATLPGAIAQQPPTIQLSQPLISTAASGPFTLPPLPYAYDALEPHIDARTMEIHHDKHHAAYVANLNKAVGQVTWGAEITPVENLLRNSLNGVPENIRTAIRNNGGGHYNHSLFWQMMKKDGGGEPTGELGKAIDTAFGNFSTFKENFSKAALGQFGSGWAWLVLRSSDDKQLSIISTANQDTSLSQTFPGPVIGPKGNEIHMPEIIFIPLLGLDVWEHAYYLKYQNKRVDYIAAWWNVVNWDFAAERYAKSAA